ncbi:MAG: ROK family protein [Candidatus Omnitrophica bacterium]|nr:ROK family protein [Candidatus Omnitrophota bacterium]
MTPENRPDQSLVAGIDLGGTQIKMGLVDQEGHVIVNGRFDTAREAGPEGFIQKAVDKLQRMTEKLGLQVDALEGIGIGIPGPVDFDSGIVDSCMNLPGWNGFPLKTALESRLGLSVAVDNDANNITLGEWLYGAAKGAHSAVCVTLGTGVGAGLILNGTLYRGSSGAAGEFGHTPIAFTGPKTASGVAGNLEAFIGNSRIVARAKDKVRKKGLSVTLQRLTAGNLDNLTPEHLSEAAALGDPLALEVWAEIGFFLGVGLAGLINLLNPDCIVLAGGVAGASKFFLPETKRTIDKRAMGVAAECAKIVMGKLKGQAGVVGSAALWRLHGDGSKGE